MAKTTTIQVTGLRELAARMQQLKVDVQGKVARATTNAGAQVIKKRAQQLVPVKTGTLKKGIVVKRIKPSETQLTSEHIVTVSTREMKKYVEKSRHAIDELQGPTQPVSVNGKTYRAKKLLIRRESYESFGDLFYGKFIEFGTVKMAPRPFLRPAYDQAKFPALEAMKARLIQRIEKAESK